MDKKMLCLACRSVRNSLEFFSMFLGLKHGPQVEKSPQIFEMWLPDLEFFQRLEMERRPPQQFSTNFGDELK